MTDLIDSKKLNQWIQSWISDESQSTLFGVLSTFGLERKPKARVVAIRELNSDGALFFTQKGSDKVEEIKQCPEVCLTLFLQNHLRQIIFEGQAIALNDDENKDYWSTYPKLSQVRFSVYGPDSGKKINSNAPLDEKLKKAIVQHSDCEVPCPESYVGYRIIPKVIKFYQLNTDRLSDSFLLTLDNQKWIKQRLVP